MDNTQQSIGQQPLDGALVRRAPYGSHARSAAGNLAVQEATSRLSTANLELQQKIGRQPLDDAFVQQVHDMTLCCVPGKLPVGETTSRLSRANLGHYVLDRADRGGGARLVAYSLNELFDTTACSVHLRVNYFCSAFLLPEMRTKYMLYQTLCALRITRDDDILLMRTQNPRAMSSFLRLCRSHGYQPYTPLSKHVPDVMREILLGRFLTDSLVHRRAYPVRIAPSEEPVTPEAKQIMSLTDPAQGDACVFVAMRPREGSLFEPGDDG